MAWKIWEFLDERGRGIVEVWLRGKKIQKQARALLNQKVDLLEEKGPDLLPGLLAGPIYDHVYKLRVTAPGVQLRPMLCKGPFNNETEFTFLLGALERGGKLEPRDAPARAAANREILIANAVRRRPHERFPDKN